MSDAGLDDRRDNFHNNIAYTPGMWIALHRICEKHGVGDQFRIHYDPSHSILMGQDTRSMFQFLKDEGYGFLIGGFHVKGQVIDTQGRRRVGLRRPDVSAATGSTASRRDNPAEQPTRGRNRPCSASTSCRAPRATIRWRTCRTARVDWLDHQLAARELLDVRHGDDAVSIVEHEYPSARVQDKELLKPILQGSIAFTRRIDEAAAAMYALQHEVLASQGIPVQGVGRQAFRS